MANKIRGREKLVTCSSCGRTMPKDKSVKYGRMNVYSTELKSGDDVKATTFVESYYCISCAKHRRIFEKLGRKAAIAAARKEREFKRPTERWNSGRRW
ncbi:MAG: 40S ribosomal protein S26 [Candidatus Micrarchaeota archaeon]|nr:40S ribosomal protein S26 [Candidatus Micrarchaeota archaeon]